jgi:hypothetical protein
VKKRFQSLPFKCNLHCYTEVDLAECPAPPKEVIESPLVNVTADGRRVKTVDGVSWGAGSLANGVHTGALLADILRFLLGDVIDTLPSSTYVELEGADIVPEETFLKSTLGYAAGLPLSYVMVGGGGYGVDQPS